MLLKFPVQRGILIPQPNYCLHMSCVASKQDGKLQVGRSVTMSQPLGHRVSPAKNFSPKRLAFPHGATPQKLCTKPHKGSLSREVKALTFSFNLGNQMPLRW